jgi:predicted NBD/HSP70 family sugar kinase
MAGWNGVELAPYLSGVTDAPLIVAGDTDILARSERRDGHATKFRDLLVVKASTGLGLGIIADGRIVSGSRGGAGEIGHTKVAAAEGRPCRCGAIGCVETIAGGWALVAALQADDRPIGHIRDLVALAVAGAPDARQLLRESARQFGEVLAVAINLLNPQAVVLGGDMAAAFDVYAAGVRESVYALSTALSTRDLQVLPSTYGDRAGLVGCAVAALDEVLSPAAVDRRLHGLPAGAVG